MSFNLEIVSPEQKLFTGRVIRLTVPAQTGQITVLSHHTPLFTTLSQGQVKYTTDKSSKKTIDISRGMLEIKENKALLLMESMESSKEAVNLRALAAQAKVKDIDKEKIKAKGSIQTEDAFRRSFITFQDIRMKRKKQTSIFSSSRSKPE
jgi:F-type H+-transporting ATPase subunit epsilon